MEMFAIWGFGGKMSSSIDIKELEVQQKVDLVERELKGKGYTVIRQNLFLEVLEAGEVVNVLINEDAQMNVDFSGFKYGNVGTVIMAVRQAFKKKHNRTQEKKKIQNLKDMILKLASHFSFRSQIPLSSYQLNSDIDNINISHLGFKFRTKVFMAFSGLDIHFSSMDIQIEEMPEIQKALQEIEDYWKIVIL